MIIENKYEGMLGSVKSANVFATRMNAIVNAVRSAGRPISARELRKYAPNPNYYLDMLTKFGILTVEIKAEEMIEINIEDYCWQSSGIITINSDNTLTFQHNKTYKPKIIHDFKIETTTGRMYHITGKQTVQVKRKYWAWKV